MVMPLALWQLQHIAGIRIPDERGGKAEDHDSDDWLTVTLKPD
jgi:hypothetical protein